MAADQPTGSVSVRLDAEGHPDFTIHRPAAYDCLALDDAQLRGWRQLQPDWIYFGTLYPMEGRARDVLRRLMEAVPRRAALLRRESAPRLLYAGTGSRTARTGRCGENE